MRATIHAPTRIQITSALAIGTIALLMPGLQPILLGELVAKNVITLEGVGLVAMGEIFCLGIGVVISSILFSVTRMRAITLAAVIVTALLDVVTMRLSGDTYFVLVRVLCGLSEGVLVWMATCTIVRCAAPDRLASIFLVAQTLTQAGVALVLALLVIPHGGWRAGFGVLGGLTLATIFLIRKICPGVEPLPEAGSSTPPASPITVLTFLIVFCQMAALGSLWAYLDPLGRSAGFDGESSQMLIALVLIMQVFGGAIAGTVIRNLNAQTTLIVCSVLQLLIAVGIYVAGGPAMVPFALLSAVFGFVWLFQMPFHIRLALRADPLGRVALLVPALQLLGVAFGPLLASFFVTDDDASMVPLICAAFAIAAILLLNVARKHVERSGMDQLENALKFKNKVVLIVGASTGMGRVMALRFAEAGATVVATARSKDKLAVLQAEIAEEGGICLDIACDALDSVEAERVVTTCIDYFGRIDFAILNAGGAPALDMRRMSATQVNDYMRLNYDVTVNYLFPVLHQMARQAGGMILHTNSLAGFLGVPLQGPYSAAKAATRILIDTCRIEFAQYGIKFVTVYPGFVATAKTIGDGMPAPFEISEELAVAHILSALRSERSDYLFPFVLRWLIRLALVLPKKLTNYILAKELPPLPPLDNTTEISPDSEQNVSSRKAD